MAGSYTLKWNLPAKRIDFALFGLWDAETMQRWDVDYRAAVAQAPGPRWTAVGDLSTYPPQVEAVQHGHEQLMAFSAAHGMVRGILVVPQAVVALQMKRLARAAKAEVVGYAASVEEALRELSAVPV